ncbi:MAG: hemerythrin domain-containing protein [Halioglobus sp.]|nr:hemerythrin domain-containing protein [Halioglobus sp.]
MAANTKAAANKLTAVKKKSSTRKRPAAQKKKATAKRSSGQRKSAAGLKGRSASAAGLRSELQKSSAEQPLMKLLRAEHRHMGTVMQLFLEQLKTIENGELIDTHVVYEIMHYMVTWPDRFHHPREDLIYLRAVEVDPRAFDDADTLQRDHDHTAKCGRAVLRDIERWRLGEISGKVVVNNGRDYVDHIYEHMNVEEKLVFPRIQAALSASDWRELAEDDELQEVADSVFGPRVQREFRNLTRKLRRSLRHSVERGTLVEWVGVEAFMESLDVVSIAYESAVGTAGDHLRGAVRDAVKYAKKDPMSAPLRCAVNNTRVAFRLLGDVFDISRETLDDLSRVNRERIDRIRLLDREAFRS